MKLCPYAIQGLCASSSFLDGDILRFAFGAIHNSKTMAEVDDKIVRHYHDLKEEEITANKAHAFCTAIVCKGIDCGRYALCNQEITQKKEQAKESKVHLFQLFYSVPTRERNIIKSAIAKHGIEYVELMTLKEWVQEKNCGLKTAHYIMDFLHGNKDDNA